MLGPDLHTSREEVTQLKQEVEQLKQFGKNWLKIQISLL